MFFKADVKANNKEFQEEFELSRGYMVIIA